MKRGLSKLQKEMYPVMVNQCLCARQITKFIMIERLDIGDNRQLLKNTVVSMLRKLASYGYVESEPEIDTSRAVYYKVLPKYTQEMSVIPEKVNPVFITDSMALIGQKWVLA